MFKKCEGAHWCTVGCVEGTDACATHLKFPQLNNLELPEDWKKRYDKEVYRQRRVKRAVEEIKRKAAVKKAAEDLKVFGKGQ